MNTHNNMTMVQEKNYSIVPDSVDIWSGSLPFKTGDTFPTQSIKDRAAISKTNKLIYQNDIEDIYSSIISILPEIDPMYGWQIREIVAQLPYFKNTVNYWKALVAGDAPVVDGDESVDIKINEIIENSNFGLYIQSELDSRFIDVIGACRVDVDINGKPTIISIDAKNLICYVSKTYTNSIEVNLIFNIYTAENGSQYIEFIEYHYDGNIKKTVFKYGDGVIGEHVTDLDKESEAFGGKFKSSPIVIFKHNTTGNEIYGTDQFRYCSSSILGAMRGLQNIFRLGERTRELVREVPDASIRKDPMTGSSIFFNKGTIGVPVGVENYPEVKYKVPEIPMEEAIKAFEKAVKCVSMDTGLGPVFFDLEKLGTNLSAKSIEAALYPTKLLAKSITTEMTPSVKELVIKLCYLADIDLSTATKFNVVWYDGFPKDIKDYTDAIQSRLGNKPSITLEDAIIALDRVPSRIAIQKANEVRQANNINDTDKKDESTIVDNKVTDKIDSNNENEKLNTHDIVPTAGINKESEQRVIGDNTVWENQVYPMPRDVPQGKSKGVDDRWIRKKLNQSH